MEKYRPSKQHKIVFVLIAIVGIVGISFLKYLTARPQSGTQADSLYQILRSPIAVPDTTLTDTTFFLSTDTLTTFTESLLWK